LPITEGHYDPHVPLELIWLFVIGPLVAAIPALILFATGSCPCSKNGFVFWMAVNALPAWILAHAAMHGLMRGRIAGKKETVLAAYYALGLALIAISVASSLWFEP